MSLFDRLFDRVGGRSGRTWAGSVEDLLFDGEAVERRVELGGGDRVVVTSHRLLAFTPGGDGENYRDVDLPNVADVRAGHEGERNLLGIGGRTLVYGAVLLAVGAFVDFGSFVPTDAFGQTGASGRLGMGGLLALLQRFLGLLARVDEFARLIGAALVLFAVFVFGVYLATRDRVLVVDVAGDADPIRVAADDALDAAVADLEVALFGSGVDDGSTAEGAAGTAEPAVGAESDPLTTESGAVESEGFLGGAEQPATEAARRPDDATPGDHATGVDRAVRETNQTDFTKTVDRVDGAADDTGPDAGADRNVDADDGDAPSGWESGFDA